MRWLASLESPLDLLICSRPASEYAAIVLSDGERFWQTSICSRYSCPELELTAFKKWILFSKVIGRGL